MGSNPRIVAKHGKLAYSAVHWSHDDHRIQDNPSVQEVAGYPTTPFRFLSKSQAHEED